ncbi:pentapeptide repeat-containing protein [Streptomyces sp. NPDC001732]
MLQLDFAVRDPLTRIARIGNASFSSAKFTGGAWFASAIFTGEAWFRSATFNGDALFNSTTFNSKAGFQSVTFNGGASFHSATFNGGASFHSATFNDEASFHSATFNDDAQFISATFTRDADFGTAGFAKLGNFVWANFGAHASFEAATFHRDALFNSAVFQQAHRLGPLTCAGALILSFTSFESPITVEASAQRVLCRRSRWSSIASLRLRYAEVGLTDAVFEYPLSIAAHAAPFGLHAGGELDESLLTGSSPAVRMLSIRGVDAAHLALTDIDLSQCLLTGAIHLDQLRLEGRVPFAPVPPGAHRRRWWLVRFSPRRTLAEEQHWRASQPSVVPGWDPAPANTSVVGPARLAPVYRSIRKAFEDGKNEPGAADFYYGEMEMRRADKEEPRAERWLLAVYWALSGYGLRATRALGWLIAAMAVTIGVMMLWGLPTHDPKPVSTGTLSGQHITLTTETPDPVNPTGPLHERVSTDRFEKSLRVVVNSVIFRSSGQNLTTTGTYTEMVSRLAEPVLLGLAILAIRGRVKR